MPADLIPFQSATPTVILAVAILVSLVKPFAEKTVLPPTAALHDAAIRVAAMAAGCLVVCLATLLALPAHAVATGPLLFTAVVEGGKAGLFAIVSYHLLTGSIFDGTSATVVQAPPAQPAEPTAVVVPPASTPTVVVQPPAVSTSSAPSALTAAATRSDAAPSVTPEAPAAPSAP